MKIGLLFPGQGSQYIGMGKEFVESNDGCAKLMELAESACEVPIRRLSFEGPMEELTRAAVLQPAITVTNLICHQALLQVLPEKMEISGFAGHSLGEYSALCAAGVISVEDAIRLVEKRGFFMEREGTIHRGGMRAVLGLDIKEIESIIAGCKSLGVVTVANYNTPQQIVISGDKDGLEAAAYAAKEAGAKVIPLNVSVANHSPLVAEAVPAFSQYLASVVFHAPKTPVYFNVTSRSETDTTRIKDMMARQIVSRVRWFEIITNMLEDGIDTFIEVGPKAVLKGMMRKIVPKGKEIVSLQVDTPESLQTCIDKLMDA